MTQSPVDVASEPLAGLGLDAGSTTCKVVGVSPAGRLLGWLLEPAHPRVGPQAERLIEALRGRLGGAAETPVVATGYGRALVEVAARQVTEITCHALGVFHEIERPGTLVDIGGQDCKVIAIGPSGRPLDFAMNDKCAAGTGRFLEVTAGRLDVPLDEMGRRALAAPDEVAISSTCTVFAESEIISLVACGVEVDPILKGLHRSLVGRIAALVRSVGLVPPLMLSGGVALNTAVRAMLAESLGTPVLVPGQPQLMGAYGAALLAAARAL
jgi:predicted CoA-substrate-specific enzyme activase